MADIMSIRLNLKGVHHIYLKVEKTIITQSSIHGMLTVFYQKVKDTKLERMQ